MTLRIDGQVIGTVEVKSTSLSDYKFDTPSLKAGSKVDLVFTNDPVSGADRNLHIAYLSDGVLTILPTINGGVVDRGNGSAAFDGLDVSPGQGDLFFNSALRMTWPTTVADSQWSNKVDAVRFLSRQRLGRRRKTSMRS